MRKQEKRREEKRREENTRTWVRFWARRKVSAMRLRRRGIYEINNGNARARGLQNDGGFLVGVEDDVVADSQCPMWPFVLSSVFSGAAIPRPPPDNTTDLINPKGLERERPTKRKYQRARETERDEREDGRDARHQPDS
ncbi:hypothetical protein TIFTF001_024349 [Ficus carica]|uniref:Uncharacterized protein n=1 Tax=Ficus carica TaxID=3494 RepID=A0AA88DGT9_FICCA|nr:hypothetical protein TIFTF001_024349 [Ficus carica]